MPLMQVTSGGQRSLLKKKLQVCERQQSCLFVGDQILIFHHNLQINSLKILQCDFLDFFSYFVSHSWGIPMMKITGLSHLFKWENLHNWWLTKYFFAPLYISSSCGRLNFLSWRRKYSLCWAFYVIIPLQVLENGGAQEPEWLHSSHSAVHDGTWGWGGGEQGGFS